MNKLFLFLLLTLIIFSCKKIENIESNNNKVDYPNGKLETTLAEKGLTMADKKQTVANELEISLLRDRIISLRKQYSKTSTKSNVVGVIRHGSCGAYPELEFRMDCEDNNNASFINTTNWNGDIHMDSKGNITFFFCIVPNYFQRVSTGDFAVLAVDIGNIPYQVSHIFRHFDNEDDNNNNYATIDGNAINQYGGNSFSGGNTDLHFWHYSKDLENGYNRFPIIGASLSKGYSLFGSINGYDHALIQTDDEDHNCLDWADANIWDPTVPGANWQGYTYYPTWYSSPGVFNFVNQSLTQLDVFKAM